MAKRSVLVCGKESQFIHQGQSSIYVYIHTYIQLYMRVAAQVITGKQETKVRMIGKYEKLLQYY